MKKERFDRLMESAKQVLQHAQGKLDLKTTYLPKPTDKKHIEDKGNKSKKLKRKIP